MLKRILVILILLMALTGCGKKEHERKLEEEMYQAYLTYYQALLDTTEKASKAQEFSTSVVVNKLDGGKYRYDLIIDEPKVAMYDVEALAIIRGESDQISTEVMMPSVGIFDDFYNMVPNQVYKDRGYVAGVVLSLTSTEPSLKIDLIVCWQDKERTETYKRFLSFDVNAEQQ
ncbi:MAG: hypothetical protein IJM15_03190 [Erysipelotrichaceae bacterium]|nr:hypothetical protein [Erysipelotrichaceae bacterium]